MGAGTPDNRSEGGGIRDVEYGVFSLAPGLSPSFNGFRRTVHSLNLVLDGLRDLSSLVR